jgi:hypothetical protein
MGLPVLMRRNKLKKTTVIGAATTTATKATKKLLNQIIKLSRNYGAGVHHSSLVPLVGNENAGMQWAEPVPILTVIQ